MEAAAARRLQPHYIRSFFLAALERLGGRAAEREPGRFELTFVPADIRNRPGRAALLRRFLEHASYIDIELRALRELRSIQRQARAQKIGCIISFHDFKQTPSLARLRAKARTAVAAGADIFKVAARTDTHAQLQRLLDFFDEQHVDLAVSAMGIGRLGRVARVEFARRGSILNYAYLGKAQLAGQLSVAQLQRFFRSLHRWCH